MTGEFLRAFWPAIIVLVILTIVGIWAWGPLWALATYAGATIGSSIVFVPMYLAYRHDR